MANTFELISSVTVGSGGAATIEFTSIPSTYTDLCLELSLRGAPANLERNIFYSFNGSTSSRTSRIIEGTGSSAASGTFTSMYGGTYPGAGATANTFSNISIYIPNYAGSQYKSSSVDAVMENNGTTSYSYLCANLWSNTAAITSIQIPSESSTNFVQYSTAYLYGVKNA